MNSSNLRTISLITTAISIGLGGLGMLASFMYLSMSSPQDITAGQAGFMAGAIAATGGVSSLAVLASCTREQYVRSHSTVTLRAATAVPRLPLRPGNL